MKVNMTPNPLDVVTIHASQGDTEARQWEFELHNNGELIDTSDITEQMFFKAYKGGTEQLLPENGSVPTTSPFKGDIRYPQGLLTDQEFTYRQSPTEEDGLAKITDIKGNTLVWNQLVPSLSAMSGRNGTMSVVDNVATITSSSSTSYLGIATSGSTVVLPKGGHKYLLTAEVNSSKALSSCNVWYGDSIAYMQINIPANTWTKVSAIASYGSPTGQYIQLRAYGSFEQGDTIQVKNWNYFDLTAMGLDSLTEDEFISLFPLPYYSYNQGSLLSFNGNGIKTVGFNQWDEEWEVGGINSSSGQPTTENDRFRSKNFISLLPNVVYYAKIEGLMNNDFRMYYYDANKNFIGVGAWQYSGTFTTPNNAWFGKFVRVNKTTFTKGDICINISDTERNGEYEPYTSSTLSLPISTYFPNGMNGHGNTYDELTSAVATKRFEKASLGDLTWTRRTTNIFSASLPSEFDVSKGISCFMSNRLPTVFVSGYTLAEDGYISIYKIEATTSSKSIYLNMASQSIDTVADLQTWLSNNPTELVYPLATPTETPITTASLVTENGEIPLSNEDGTLIGKCTEELSAEPGFHDAKIKLSDADGECYSNKLQLHVERSPQ